MIKDLNFFIKKTYEYYPKNINSFFDDVLYKNSIEYNNLILIIEKHKNYKNSKLENLIIEISKLIPSYRFDDNTLFDWLDRAYNFSFSFIENKKISLIKIKISLIIDFYIIESHIVDINDKGFYLSAPVKSNKNNEIKENISKLVKKTLKIDVFPDIYINHILNDISFQDINFGKFTLYNSFFLNE